MTTREQIISKAQRLRSEVRQTFIDIAHWNDCVRQPHEAPVDPDPDGQLRAIDDQCSRIIDGGALRS